MASATTLNALASHIEVHPVGINVLIRRDPVPDQSPGGILLAKTVFDRSEMSFGTVLAVGGDATLGVTAGNRVAFVDEGYALDDERTIVDQASILAIIR